MTAAETCPSCKATASRALDEARRSLAGETAPYVPGARLGTVTEAGLRQDLAAMSEQLAAMTRERDVLEATVERQAPVVAAARAVVAAAPNCECYTVCARLATHAQRTYGSWPRWCDFHAHSGAVPDPEASAVQELKEAIAAMGANGPTVPVDSVAPAPRGADPEFVEHVGPLRECKGRWRWRSGPCLHIEARCSGSGKGVG